MKYNLHKIKSGEVTIMLVLIILILATITTAAVALAISTTLDTTTNTLGERALTVAESGAEATILELLRNPSYNPVSPSNTLSIGPGNATITVTGSSPTIITSTGVVGNMVRSVQVETNIINGQLSVVSWQEL
jgi:hypothetical protein